MVVCLLVGGLVGVRVGGWVLDRHDGGVTLHAGQVQDLGSCRHRCLRLPLFNDGTRPVRVTGVGFAGWRVVADARAAVVPPGTWGSVRFALPVDCAAPEPASYRTVSVRATVAGVRGERTLRMPGATPLVRRDHDLACPVGRPATAADLRGVWMLESAYGAWHSLVGRLLMRFGADGSFAWDSSGHLLDPALAPPGATVSTAGG